MAFASRGCGNVEIARLAISKGSWAVSENLLLVFLTVHSPSFPQPFPLTRFSSERSRRTASLWLAAFCSRHRNRFALRSAVPVRRRCDLRSGIQPLRAVDEGSPTELHTTYRYVWFFPCRPSAVPELRRAGESSDTD